MKKYLVPIIMVVVVAGAVGLGVLLNKTSTPNVTLQGNEITDADHRRGNADAKIQLIEYGDTQCPACAAAQPWVNQIMNEHGSEINFAFRHFPLKTIHRNAVHGNEAAEAASIQGKFFEMEDLLFSKQPEWSNLPDPGSKFAEYARSLGLNEDQFISDYNSKAVSDKVESGYQTGLNLGLNSTPSFFVNGVKIANPSSYDEFVQIVLNSPASANTSAN